MISSWHESIGIASVVKPPVPFQVEPMLTSSQCACETGSQLIQKETCEECSIARCANCRVGKHLLRKRESKGKVRWFPRGSSST